jgi:hypothetical protein
MKPSNQNETVVDNQSLIDKKKMEKMTLIHTLKSGVSNGGKKYD